MAKEKKEKKEKKHKKDKKDKKEKKDKKDKKEKKHKKHRSRERERSDEEGQGQAPDAPRFPLPTDLTAVAELQKLLNAFPALAEDLAKICDTLDDGEVAQFGGVANAAVRDGLVSTFSALGMTRVGDAGFVFELAAARKSALKDRSDDSDLAIAARALPPAPLLTLVAALIDESGFLDVAGRAREAGAAAATSVRELLERWPALEEELPGMLLQLYHGDEVDTAMLPDEELKAGIEGLLGIAGLAASEDGYGMPEAPAAAAVARSVLEGVLTRHLGLEQADLEAGGDDDDDDDEDDESQEGEQGKASAQGEGAAAAGVAPKRTGPVGPAMPSREQLAQMAAQQDSDDEDDVGPQMSGKARAPTAAALAQALDAKEKGKAGVGGAKAHVPGTREEWMMVAPEDDGTPNIFGLPTNRSFQVHTRKGGRATAAGLRADKERAAAAVQQDPRKLAEEQALLDELEAQRGPSLMDVHQDRLARGEKIERKGAAPWDGDPRKRGRGGGGGGGGRVSLDDDDMKDYSGRKKMSRREVDDMIRDARGLKSRFKRSNLL